MNHTFDPVDVINTVGRVEENAGLPAGNPSVAISRGPKTPSGQIKPRMTLTVPVVVNETINGVVVPRVVRTARAAVEFTFDQMSSEAERNDVVGMLQSALTPAKTLVHDTVVKLQGVY